jgi:hypothetical protein
MCERALINTSRNFDFKIKDTVENTKITQGEDICEFQIPLHTSIESHGFQLHCYFHVTFHVTADR